MQQYPATQKVKNKVRKKCGPERGGVRTGQSSALCRCRPESRPSWWGILAAAWAPVRPARRRPRRRRPAWGWSCSCSWGRRTCSACRPCSRGARASLGTRRCFRCIPKSKYSHDQYNRKGKKFLKMENRTRKYLICSLSMLDCFMRA